MFQAKYATPNRRKSTIDETYTDKRLKSSNVDSACSRDSKLRKGNCFRYAEIIHWQNYEHRRDSRINSMLKIRKEKLEEITEENQKIFIRINDQQSHYPSFKHFQTIDRKNKQNQNEDAMMGHLRDFSTPACFLVGDRGIMCEQRLGVDNVIFKKSEKKLPLLGKGENREKEYRSVERSGMGKTRELVFYPSNKERRLPDIYMMI